ncbi:hypothetical protein BD779DRAFT_1478861 [Infundibulicybe gibba]|nr:hypothetical protein BD779DRAFT_1478861 [Infundibulicybe gibba]
MTDTNRAQGVPVYPCIVVANPVEEYEDIPALEPVEFDREGAPPDEAGYEDMPELEMAEPEVVDEVSSQDMAIAWYVQSYLGRGRSGRATHTMRGNTYHSGSHGTLIFPDFEALIAISEYVQPRRLIRPPGMRRIEGQCPRVMHWLMQILYDNNALFYCEFQRRGSIGAMLQIHSPMLNIDQDLLRRPG